MSWRVSIQEIRSLGLAYPHRLAKLLIRPTGSYGQAVCMTQSVMELISVRLTSTLHASPNAIQDPKCSAPIVFMVFMSWRASILAIHSLGLARLSRENTRRIFGVDAVSCTK